MPDGSAFTLPSGEAVHFQFLSFGIYTATVTEISAAPRLAAPFYKLGDDFTLVRQTDTIAAELGLTFGISFTLSGDAGTEDVAMRWITRFPSGGITDQHGTTFEADAMLCDVPIGMVVYRVYSFDAPWEMVPGDWSLEFWSEGEMIAAKGFTVTVP